MITKVKVKNFMSWAGTHEIDYKEGLTLFDGNYGVGKSSLLVDSLDLVFSGKARDKLQELITKGKKDMQVDVEMQVKEKDYKFLFYYKKKGEEIGKNGKMKKVSASTIWKSYIKENDEWCEIDQSPETILGVDYKLVAKKTFLIGQFDLDTFSKAKPSEKYDIIAESFQISKLFAIGNKAQDKIKVLSIKKQGLTENFSHIDTSEFDKKDGLEKNIKQITKEIEKLEKEENNNRKKREKLLLQEQEQKNKEDLESRKIFYEKNIADINKIDIQQEEKNIQNIKIKIEKSKNPIIEKLQDKINIENTKLIFEKEKKENKIEEIKNKNIFQINEKSQQIKEVIRSLSEIPLYQNKELIEQIEKDKDILIKIDKKNCEEIIDKMNKDLQEVEILLQIKENDRLNNKNLKKDIATIKTSSCPTCHRPLTPKIKKELLETIDKEALFINKELSALINKKSELLETKEKNEKVLQQTSLFSDYLKIQELKKTGITEQENLKEIKVKMEKELLQATDKINKEEKKIENEIIGLEKELKEQLSKDKTQVLEKELKELENKEYIINNGIYSINNLKTFKIEQENTLKEIDKSINKTKEFIKDYKNEDLKEVTSKLESLEPLIKEKREYFTEVNNRLTIIKQNEDNYKKIEKSVKEINERISILEKIKVVFGKKGEPKTILQNYIIPNLENNINDILEDITDGYYRIEFKLSNETLDGSESKKNTFDIIVYQQGISQTYETLSGGERTNINYAIRLGITTTLNDILGEKISDFLVLDEVFRGDLDSENGGENLVNSVIQTMKSGRFKQIFIITHTDYIKEKLENTSNVVKIEKRGNYSEIV